MVTGHDFVFIVDRLVRLVVEYGLGFLSYRQGLSCSRWHPPTPWERGGGLSRPAVSWEPVSSLNDPGGGGP